MPGSGDTLALPYDDRLTYGILVCHEADGPVVRQRHSIFQVSGDEITDMLVSYHRAWGCVVDWRVGPLGSERTRRFAEGNALYEVREDGVPSATCADIDRFYPEED